MAIQAVGQDDDPIFVTLDNSQAYPVAAKEAIKVAEFAKP